MRFLFPLNRGSLTDKGARGRKNPAPDAHRETRAFGKGKADIGRQAEDIAARHLEARGLRLLERNYRRPFGEVDLIMLDADTLVFVEVKYRRDELWMPIAASIHPKQCQRIIRASEHYLQNQTRGHQDCRFDVMLLVGELPAPRIEWVKHAFTA